MFVAQGGGGRRNAAQKPLSNDTWCYTQRYIKLTNLFIYLSIYLFLFISPRRGAKKNLNTPELLFLHENAPLQIILCKSVEQFLNKQSKSSKLTKIQIFSPNGATGSQLSPNRSK